MSSFPRCVEVWPREIRCERAWSTSAQRLLHGSSRESSRGFQAVDTGGNCPTGSARVGFGTGLRRFAVGLFVLCEVCCRRSRRDFTVLGRPEFGMVDRSVVDSGVAVNHPACTFRNMAWNSFDFFLLFLFFLLFVFPGLSLLSFPRPFYGLPLLSYLPTLSRQCGVPNGCVGLRWTEPMLPVAVGRVGVQNERFAASV